MASRLKLVINIFFTDLDGVGSLDALLASNEGVKHGALKLIHGRQEKPLSSGLGLGIHRVGDGTEENSLGARARHGNLVVSLLHTNPQLSIASKGGDAGEVVVDAEAGELEQVGEAGAHIAAKGCLRVVVAVKEGEVPREPGRLFAKQRNSES